MICRFILPILPVVAVLLATTGSVAGQLYYHSPNDTLTAETTVNSQVTMNITQIHPGMDTLFFSWTKLSADLPEGWLATICDNVTCYPGLMESGETLPVLPGDNGLMLIHCTTNSQVGTGIIRYTISERTTPQQVDTLTWIITVSGFAEVENIQSGDPSFTNNAGCIHIFDTGHRFNRFSLIDLSGKIVYSCHLSLEKELVLPSNLHGTFIVLLSGDTTNVRKKIVL